MSSTQPKHTSYLREKFALRVPKPPAESHSRAGRNLPAAIITGLLLLAIVAASVVFYIEIFMLLATIALVIGLWEYACAVLARDYHIPVVTVCISVVCMCVLTWRFNPAYGFFGYLLAVGLIFGIVRYFYEAELRLALITVFGLSWIGLSGIFAIALAALPQGAEFIAALVLLPAANDTGGWIAGILFGKHPIAPKISPKKSWEGFLGSLALAILISYLAVGLLIGLDWSWILLFGIITPFVATAGDFAESMIKRDLGIKDMGSLFPGHGGMLDRLDSILFCAPLFYFLFALASGAI